MCHPEFNSLTLWMRKLRFRGEEGLAKVTLLLSDKADLGLEVTCKPKSKRGSKQTHLSFFQRIFCSKPLLEALLYPRAFLGLIWQSQEENMLRFANVCK